MEEEKKKRHPLCKLFWIALKITGLVLLVKWLKGKIAGKCECCGNEPCTCGPECECGEEKDGKMI